MIDTTEHLATEDGFWTDELVARYASDLLAENKRLRAERDKLNEHLDKMALAVGTSGCVLEYRTTENGPTGMTNVRAEAAEAELARLREENRWIPVSEKLPNEGQWALFVHDGLRGPDLGYRRELKNYKRGGWQGRFNVIRDESVTHWRPLPSPPAEKEKP